MKITRHLIILLLVCFTLSSCSVWNRIFPAKYGCGTDGKNVGAEKVNDAINSGEKLPKAKKFKA